MHPINIELTEHVCKRYIERFAQNLTAVKDVNERLKRAKRDIHSILRAAHYVSDSNEGILLHSPVHKCNLIVRNRILITLWKPERNKNKTYRGNEDKAWSNDER